MKLALLLVYKGFLCGKDCYRRILIKQLTIKACK